MININPTFFDTLDFMLSERRDEEAATAFFKQAINNNGFPDKVVMDKSGANYASLANIAGIFSSDNCPFRIICAVSIPAIVA
jgi:transposase-like protein